MKSKKILILLLAGVFLLDFIPAAIVSGTSIPTWTASALPQASILKKFRLFEQKETEKTTANDAQRNPVERQKEELDRVKILPDHDLRKTTIRQIEESANPESCYRLRRETGTDSEPKSVLIQCLNAIQGFLTQVFVKALEFWMKTIARVKESLNLKIIRLNSLPGAQDFMEVYKSYNISKSSPLFLVTGGIKFPTAVRGESNTNPISLDDLFKENWESEALNTETRTKYAELELDASIDYTQIVRENFDLFGFGETLIRLFSEALQNWLQEGIDLFKFLNVKIIRLNSLEDAEDLPQILRTYKISKVLPLLVLSAGMKLNTSQETNHLVSLNDIFLGLKENLPQSTGSGIEFASITFRGNTFLDEFTTGENVNKSIDDPLQLAHPVLLASQLSGGINEEQHVSEGQPVSLTNQDLELNRPALVTEGAESIVDSKTTQLAQEKPKTAAESELVGLTILPGGLDKEAVVTSTESNPASPAEHIGLKIPSEEMKKEANIGEAEEPISSARPVESDIKSETEAVETPASKITFYQEVAPYVVAPIRPNVRPTLKLTKYGSNLLATFSKSRESSP